MHPSTFHSLLPKPALRYMYVNRLRILSMLALLALALGSLGQILQKWQPDVISFLPWDIYLASLFSAYKQGSLTPAAFLHTPQGPWASASAAWQYLGYILNNHMADPTWQLFWRGLWRVAMAGLLYWLLTHRRQVKANWFIAIAVAGVAAFPTDWQNLINASGTSQFMAICTGLLAIHCWTSHTTKKVPRYLSQTAQWWAGWCWYLLAGVCAPTALLAAPAVGLVTCASGVRDKNRSKQMRGVATCFIGIVIVIIAWLTQGGPSLQYSPMMFLYRFLTFLSHPYADLAWPGLVIWLPFVALLWQRFGSSRQSAHMPLFNQCSADKLMAIGLWAMLMMLMLSAGQTPASPAGLWLNPSSLVLGLVINTCIVAQLIGSCTKIRQHSPTAIKLQSCTQGMQLKHGVILGWCILLALGYWQSVNHVQGWQEGPRQQIAADLAMDTQVHRYFLTGNPAWLSDSASAKQGVDLSPLRTWLDNPQIRKALPASVLPPPKPSRYLATGYTKHPSFAANAPLGRFSDMGILQRHGQLGQDSRLGLQYQTDPAWRYFRIKVIAKGFYANDFNLTIIQNDKAVTLIGHDHPLPYTNLVIRTLKNISLPEDLIFASDTGAFEIDLRRPATTNDGMLLMISPQPIGLARYHLISWLAWSDFLAGLGIVMLLVIAARLFLSLHAQRAQPTTCLQHQPGTVSLLAPASWPWRRWWPMLATLLAACVILFIRKSDAFINPQFWAEDGTVFFAGQFNHGLKAIFIPYNGYLHLVPRLIAAFCSIFLPYVYHPFAYNLLALLITLAVITSIFSRRLPFSLQQKVLMALATVLMVQGGGEIYLNITNLQWIMVLLLLLTAIKSPPDPRNGSIKRQWTADLTVVILIGLTGPFIVLLLPVYLLMAALRRNRHSLTLLVTAGLAMAVQCNFMATSSPHAPNTISQFFSPEQAIPMVIGHRLFSQWVLFGFSYDNISPVLLCCLLACTWVLFIVTACRERQLRWPILCFLFLHIIVAASALYRFGEGLIFLIQINVSRYFFIPLLMLTWCMIMLLASQFVWQRRLAIVVLACVLACSLQTYFIANPWPDLNWQAHASAIKPGKSVSIPINPHTLNLMIELNPPPKDTISNQQK